MNPFVARGRLSRFKSLILPGLSAILLALSFPKFNLEVLAWFAFVPLFSAIENTSKRKSFILFFICGLVFWVITIWWIIHVTFWGAVLLILYLALYFGFFGFILSAIRNTPHALRLFSIPAIWVLLEYLRSHLLTGFPWALLGYSQYLNLPVIQIADIFGVWGVSFVVMIVNSAVYWLLKQKFTRTQSHKADKVSIIFACLLVVSAVVYGFFKLRNTPSAIHNMPIKISVVQGNIPQEMEWEITAAEDIVNKYCFLSQLAGRENPDLIIWPEAAVPGILGNDSVNFNSVRRLAKQLGAALFFGSVTARGDSYYNSAILVSEKGELSGQYDKLHLVPFGEYIPLRHIFPFLQAVVPIGDETPGVEFVVFSVNSTNGPGLGRIFKFSSMICFEDVFPEISRQFVKSGAQFLVNITNDSWFKKSSAAYQHFQSSVFRAVENRVFVLRSANTGVSGFISPEGKINSLVADASGREIFVAGYKTEEIFVRQGSQSFYTRFGDGTIIAISSLFMFITCLLAFRRLPRGGAGGSRWPASVKNVRHSG